MKNDLLEKAEGLLEALPYIQKFRGAVVVIKFGGSAMEDPELVRSTMRDVVLLECIGIKTIVVHGGGKAITAELKRQNITGEFVFGLRRTDAKTISVVDDVLHRLVNNNLVELGRAAGGRTVGLSGKNMLTAEKLFASDPVSGEQVDIGFVGNVTSVDPSPIFSVLSNGEFRLLRPLEKGLMVRFTTSMPILPPAGLPKLLAPGNWSF